MSEAIRIASVAAIPPGARTVVEARGKRIAVFNVGGRFHAIDEACSHEGGPLSEGTLDGTVVTCPWHGARFDVTTGAVLRPPARRAVASYAVRVSGPDLLLELLAAAEGSRGTGAEPATVSADPAQPATGRTPVAPAPTQLEAGPATIGTEPAQRGTGPAQLVLASRRSEAEDVTSFLFRSERPLEWRAGQFLRYTLRHADPDGRGISRYFTIASAPFEGHVMLTTRFAAREGSSFKRALRELPVDARVEVGQPAGDFTLSRPELPHVLLAGGIGITPFRAMLLDLDHRRLPVNATLLYASRTPDLVYRGELEALQRRQPGLLMHPFVSPRRITAEAIASLTHDLGTAVFLVSGPEPFVEGLGGVLSSLGVPEARVKRDYFPGYEWAH
jgi:ferredoxin-NADP reductase/nitrite reductase/ring-hydroxylating ferredoxin subunit